MLLKQNSCHLDGSSCLLFLVIFLVYLTRGGSFLPGDGYFGELCQDARQVFWDLPPTY